MRHVVRTSLSIIALVAGLLWSAPMALAAPRGRPIGTGDGLVQVNFTRVDVRDLVRNIGRATSQKILLDDGVRGTITVVAKRKVPQALALQILASALQVKGYGLIEGPAGILKVVPVNESLGESPLREEAGPVGETPMVILQSLDYANPDDVVNVVKPLVGAGSVILAYSDTNSLIIGGPERRVARLMTLIRAIDVDTRRELHIRSLRYRDVESAVELLETRFGGRQNPLAQFDVWVDDRTNRLILRSTREVYEEVDAFLADIDEPLVTEGEINVIRILNRDPKDIADIVEKQRSTGSERSRAPVAVSTDEANPGEALENVAELSTRDFTIAVDEPTRSLVVRSDGETLDLIRELVKVLDRPVPMVEVEVLIFELNTPRTWGVELNLLGTFSNSTTKLKQGDPVIRVASDPFGDGFQALPSGGLFAGLQRGRVLIPFRDPQGNIRFLEDFLSRAGFAASESEARSTLVARPHLAMISGEEHEIFVGDNVPVPVQRGQPQLGSQATDPAGLATGRPLVSTSQTIERTDVGTLLRITPTIGAEGSVKLDMDVEVSRLSPSLAEVAAAVGPTFLKRNLTVKADLDPDEFAVLGLYESDTSERLESGVPFLRKIPVLGHLFRGEARSDRTVRLVIAVKARSIGDADALRLASIRRRLAFERVNAEADRLQVDEPYAVLVTTRTREDDAITIAESLEMRGLRPRIKRWTTRDEVVFDVYAIGFESMADAGELAVELAEEGWDPEVVVASRP